jgi:hypothetical protein
MFNRKKIKALEEELASCKEQMEEYRRIIVKKEQTIRTYRNFSTGVIPVKVTYTITESDLYRYAVSKIPRVAKDRKADSIATQIKKNFEPEPVFDDRGVLIRYEYDIYVSQRRGNTELEEEMDRTLGIL